MHAKIQSFHGTLVSRCARWLDQAGRRIPRVHVGVLPHRPLPQGLPAFAHPPNSRYRPHAWRGDKDAGEYKDIPGFCKSATLEGDPQARLRAHARPLCRREMQEDDGEPFEEKMKRLVVQLREQQAEAARLDAMIAANLKELGYGG